MPSVPWVMAEATSWAIDWRTAAVSTKQVKIREVYYLHWNIIRAGPRMATGATSPMYRRVVTVN